MGLGSIFLLSCALLATGQALKAAYLTTYHEEADYQGEQLLGNFDLLLMCDQCRPAGVDAVSPPAYPSLRCHFASYSFRKNKTVS